MDIFIKKTTELTVEEKASMLDCFIDVFKHERTMEEMLNQYNNTPLGYSFHSFASDNGRIIAAHTAFPSYYWVSDKRIKAYITGDTMVRREYRDGLVYMDITMGLTSFMKKEGYSFSFGFPNENTYAIHKKSKQSIEFGRLDTYVIPYRLGGIKKGLVLLSPLSMCFCNIWLSLCCLFSKDILSNPLIHKDDETYNPVRYKRMDGAYQHVKLLETEFYYKVKKHEGVRTAFLIDVIGKSEKRLCKAAQYILRKEKANVDLVLYVGHMPSNLKKTGFLRIPQKYEPKHFYMTGKVYDKGLDSKLVCDINNWDVNLSDYDLI